VVEAVKRKAIFEVTQDTTKKGPQNMTERRTKKTPTHEIQMYLDGSLETEYSDWGSLSGRDRV
jgi:hypothetical protein